MTGRASSPRLVGREEELARLRAAVADAAAVRSRFVLVAGEAGIGKSRLAAELVVSPGEAVHALVGRCLAIAHGGLPYAPLAGALRRLGRDLDPATLAQVLGPARADLARLVPDLAAGGWPGPEVPVGAADRVGRARLFELLLGFFARLGADRPVLFVVEDVHWADDATRDLLMYLVANLWAERVALVATLRTDAVGLDPGFASWLVELARASGSERLDLGPLSPEQVADQVRAILGSPPRPPLAAAIAARSGGNAPFVEALVAAGAGAGPDGGEDAGAAVGGRSFRHFRGSPPPDRGLRPAHRVCAAPVLGRGRPAPQGERRPLGSVQPDAIRGHHLAESPDPRVRRACLIDFPGPSGA